MDLRLDSIIIFVHDIAKLKTFYTRVFQLVIVEEIPGEWVLLSAGTARIGLHKTGKAYTETKKENSAAGNNTKIVFEITEDIHRTREQLAAQNISVSAVTSFEGYNYWICDGTDPEGNVFQLKQKK